MGAVSHFSPEPSLFHALPDSCIASIAHFFVPRASYFTFSSKKVFSRVLAGEKRPLTWVITCYNRPDPSERSASPLKMGLLDDEKNYYTVAKTPTYWCASRYDISQIIECNPGLFSKVIRLAAKMILSPKVGFLCPDPTLDPLAEELAAFSQRAVWSLADQPLIAASPEALTILAYLNPNKLARSNPDHRAAMLAAVTDNWPSLVHASKALCTDEEIIKAALSQSPSAAVLITPSLKP